jgi:hypothetical protein
MERHVGANASFLKRSNIAGRPVLGIGDDALRVQLAAKERAAVRRN